jgi:chromatin segregation and condensation protein Rec8/ScpA/Scc1 (kleisin family)
MTDEASRIARLEERVKTLFSAQQDFRQAVTDGQRELKTEIVRLAGLIENGKLHDYRLDEAAAERKRIVDSMLTCRTTCQSRLDEIEEWRDQWRGKLSVIGFLVAAFVTVLSSFVTLLARRFMG